LKLLIAGGGTGGHIFPALAVAKQFSITNPKENVLFIGTRRGLESTLIPKHGFNIKYVKVRGIKRTSFFNTLVAIMEIPLAILSSMLTILTFRPNFVVGVGGYASGPALIAAFLLGKKTAVMEQNSVPGATNKILSKFVKHIFITYEHNRQFFPENKIVHAGNPVSHDFLEKIKNHIPVPEKKIVLTILGGSQGSRIVNNNVIDALHILDTPEERLKIVHQCGKTDFDKVKGAYKHVRFEHNVQDFFDNMPELYLTSDIIICRAGAMTISELQIAGKASILIPFAKAADNHQELNAIELAQNGAAIIIKENELTPQKLADLIKELINNPKRTSDMEYKAKLMGKPDAAKIIVDVISSYKRK
jgi:UDP-N-acetylglucosamine--N-acetylmuramyl-(pentapeptide) pyrophosphoryl-undecaprenol N-acetylglucosamine transferase